jgi:hypothetical protein
METTRLAAALNTIQSDRVRINITVYVTTKRKKGTYGWVVTTCDSNPAMGYRFICGHSVTTLQAYA